MDIKEFKQKILDKLKGNGVDVSKFHLEVLNFIDENHLCSLWYGAGVATVNYKGHKFYLEANGDIRFDLYDENNEWIDGFVDKRNGGSLYGWNNDLLPNDEALSQLIEKNRIIFQNNNWFEIVVADSEGNVYDLMDVRDENELDEAIISMIEDMDKIIKYIEDN